MNPIMQIFRSGILTYIVWNFALQKNTTKKKLQHLC